MRGYIVVGAVLWKAQVRRNESVAPSINMVQRAYRPVVLSEEQNANLPPPRLIYDGNSSQIESPWLCVLPGLGALSRLGSSLFASSP